MSLILLELFFFFFFGREAHRSENFVSILLKTADFSLSTPLILEINDKILNSNICALFDLVCYPKQSNVKIKTNLT